MRSRAATALRDWRAWPTTILAVAAGVTPPLAVLAPLSLVIVLSVAAASVGVIALVANRSLSLPCRLLRLVGVFALWSGASVFWALDPIPAVTLLQSVLLVALGGMILIGAATGLDEAARMRVSSWLLIGFIAALLLLGIFLLAHFVFDISLLALVGLSRHSEWASHNRGAVILALLLWPASMAVRQRYGTAAAIMLAAITFAVLLGYYSATASVALLSGALIALLAYVGAKLAANLVCAVVFITIALTPIVPPHFGVADLSDKPIPMSIYHRLVIWNFSAERISEKPLHGWGFNTSRILPGGDARAAHAPTQSTVSVMSLHPHNAVLQLWLELGLPGAALGAILVIIAVRAVREDTRDPVWQAAALGLITAEFTAAFLNYGIWQRWWMSTLWLTAALMVAVGRSTASARPVSRADEPQIRPQIPGQVC